jgi:hypothetical protein
MTLPLTPEMLETLYDFLCTTPPFNRMKMPPSEEVKFVISLGTDYFAKYRWDGSQHNVIVSAKAIAHTHTLVEKFSHELVHLSLEKDGLESKQGGPNVHNAHFKKRAALVCKYHGFDPKAFY